MELAVRAAAEGLDVVGVRQPIVWPHVAFERHVVDVLVDVEEVAYLHEDFLSSQYGETRGKRLKLRPGFPVAHLLVVGSVAQVELVHVVEVDAVVAVGKVLVVAFADVEHAVVHAVEEDVGGLIVLAIDIEAALEDYRLNSRVFDAGVGVVAAVTDLPAAILVVGLEGEDRIVDGSHTFVLLVRLESEGAACFPIPAIHGSVAVGSCPAATYLQVHLLIQLHGIAEIAVGILFGNEVLHVHGSFPIHVPVAWRGLSVSCNAIGSLDEHADLVVEEVLRLRDDGEDGQIVGVVGIDVGSCDDRTWQEAFLEEAEAQNGGFLDVEAAVGARLAVGESRRAAVGGVAECSSSGYLDLNVEAFGEDAAVGAHNRRGQSLLAEVAGGVACFGCRFGSHSPFLAAIGGTCPRTAGNRLGVGDGRDDR